MNKRPYTLISVVLIILMTVAPLLSSCGIPETPAIEEEERENPHDTLFNILSLENNYKNEINLKNLRDFYAAGFPADLPGRLAATPSYADINITADIDASVFGEDDAYAGFATRLMKDAKLSVNAARDPASKNSKANVTVSLAGQKLETAEILIENGERAGIKLEELYPRFVTLDYGVLMAIISDSTKNAALSRITFDNISSLTEKLVSFLRSADTGGGRSALIKKPFIEKLSDAISDERVSVEYGVTVDGAPGTAYKKVSVTLANDDLRQALTAFVQAAKENTELLALLKEKYAGFYELAEGLADLGFNPDQYVESLPPADGIDALLQSSFAAFEVMLGSADSLPVKALSIDFFLDGAVLHCIDANAWTNTPGDGAPDIIINIRSLDDGAGVRTDSFAAAFVTDSGDKNIITLLSKLEADKNGGVNEISAEMSGPAFDGAVPDIDVSFSWGAGRKAVSVDSYFNGEAGKPEPALRFSGEMVDNDEGDGCGFNAELSVFGLIAVNCDGALTFGQSPIPSLRNEDAVYLTQDSFYDGAFEAIYNEFYINLIRFASANRQLLNLYGFPGF